MSEQRSAPALVDVKTLVVSFASDFFAGGVASGFTKSAMAPIERCERRKGSGGALSEQIKNCAAPRGYGVRLPSDLAAEPTSVYIGVGSRLSLTSWLQALFPVRHSLCSLSATSQLQQKIPTGRTQPAELAAVWVELQVT